MPEDMLLAAGRSRYRWQFPDMACPCHGIAVATGPGCNPGKFGGEAANGIAFGHECESSCGQDAAAFDDLTGLPSRLLLMDRLRQAMALADRETHTVAVCYLDLDGFKAINDRYGRAVGDQLLQSVARRLQDSLRSIDTVSRSAGDEFVFLLPGLRGLSEVQDILARVVERIEQAHIVDAEEICILASIGIALYPDDRSDAETLLRHADKAMNLAKQDGCGQYRFFSNPILREPAPVSAGRLRLAIEHEELCLYYQPKVDLRDGSVIGLEALVRWRHPEKGLLLPGAFLPFVEKSAFMCELDTWVIDRAIRQILSWGAEIPKVRISVNVSACSLESMSFVQMLTGKLQALPLGPARRLDFEILESSAIHDLKAVSHLIDACHGLGISFSLDDFGTGYSSLSHLKRLNVDTVKIDRLFIRDIDTNPDDLALVKAVVGLTTAYRRQVVAEGVETREQGRILMASGCFHAQGFGISSPIPAEQVPDWCRQARDIQGAWPMECR